MLGLTCEEKIIETIDGNHAIYDYTLTYQVLGAEAVETKSFRIGQAVEVYANRKWKPAHVAKMTRQSVYVHYTKNKNGRLVLGRVDMSAWDSAAGLSFKKIRGYHAAQS